MVLQLNVQTLGQRDPRWANQRLGTVNGRTIGSDGCVVTSLCMLYTYYGKSVLPNQLDNYLTDNKVYQNGNLFTMSTVNKYYDKVTLEKMVDCRAVPAPITDIKKALDSGKPCFVWLMNGGVEHCTLAVGYDGNEIIVNDPWIGDKVKISDRWGISAEKIIYVNYFTGPVPAPIQTPGAAPTGTEAEQAKDKQLQFDRLIIYAKSVGLIESDDSRRYLFNEQVVKLFKALKEDRDKQAAKAHTLDLVNNDWLHFSSTDNLTYQLVSEKLAQLAFSPQKDKQITDLKEQNSKLQSVSDAIKKLLA